jgi:hypothetical protein
MDLLYYSNYCKHSKEVLDFLVKNDIIKSLNSICVDRRKVDTKTGQVHVILENGNSVLLPPNIHSVPSLLLTKENYRCISGKDIIQLYRSSVNESQDIATQGNGEPMAFSLGAKDIQSEAFTFYNASPEELSAKGTGGMRPLYNYVPANQDLPNINTPPDTHKSEKLSSDVTVDSIQSQRTSDMNNVMQNINQTPFIPKTT